MTLSNCTLLRFSERKRYLPSRHTRHTHLPIFLPTHTSLSQVQKGRPAALILPTASRYILSAVSGSKRLTSLIIAPKSVGYYFVLRDNFMRTTRDVETSCTGSRTRGHGGGPATTRQSGRCSYSHTETRKGRLGVVGHFHIVYVRQSFLFPSNSIELSIVAFSPLLLSAIFKFTCIYLVSHGTSLAPTQTRTATYYFPSPPFPDLVKHANILFLESQPAPYTPPI